MTDTALPFITADRVRERVSMADAVEGLDAALQAGFDPSTAPARSNLPLSHGSLLLMPAEAGDYVGVKIASVAPDNPAAGLPKIQGSYLFMSASTLAPLAMMEGAALTEIRTPALSALGVKHLAREGAPLRVALFGTGPAGLQPRCRHRRGARDRTDRRHRPHGGESGGAGVPPGLRRL